MNPTYDFDRQLAAWLGNEAPPKAPAGLLDGALDRAGALGQRRAWLFREWWIPTQTAMRLATVSRGALYAIVILALAILLAMAMFVVGQQHRLPPPIGLAANGLIADDSHGQIALLSEGGQAVRTVTDETEIAISPAFSADGQKIAYLSAPRPANIPLSAPTSDQWNALRRMPASVMVVNVEGGPPTAIATNVSVNNPRLQWSHAGDAIAYSEFATDALSNVKIISTIGAPPVTIPLVSTPVWSPDDKLIALVKPNQGLYVVERDGNNLRSLGHPASMEAGFGWPDWSADGSTIVYYASNGHGLTINTVNKDGTDDRVITDTADGSEQAYWPRFSPDGTKIAFIRSGVGLDLGGYPVIANADGSAYRQFPIALKFGNVGFSPDGKYLIASDYDRANIVLVDTVNGLVQQIPSTGTGNASWQRLAP